MKRKIRKFLCDVMGWHKPSPRCTSDGVNILSTCKYCGRQIALDSQGNWFDI